MGKFKDIDTARKEEFTIIGGPSEDTNSGVKHDRDKPITALLPPVALEEEAWVWTFGARKYGNYNWTKGISYVRIISATLRHLLEIMKGNDVDPESNRLHAAHIRCNMGMLIEFQKSDRTDLDDRSK